MEFIDGDTVAHLIRERSPLLLSRRLEIIEAVCNALEHAHKKGIIHRDIKPGNVMVSREGLVKVLDFGIALAADSSAKPGGSGRIGTLGYMSPEQVESLAVDQRSDIFSVGAVAYELLSSSPAFEGRTPDDVEAVVRGVPAPLSLRVPGIDPALEKIVEKALEKDKARRYQQISDMAGDLAAVRRRAQTDGSDEYYARLPLSPVSQNLDTATKGSRPWDETVAPPPTMTVPPESVFGNSRPQIQAPLDMPTAVHPPRRDLPAAQTGLPGPPKSASGLGILALPAAAIAKAVDAVKGLFRRSALPDTTSSSPAIPAKGESTTPQQGPILLGVSAPRDTSPAATFTARFVAYVESRQDSVKQRLNQLDQGSEESVQAVVGLSPERGGRWLVGTPVTVRLSGEHLRVEPTTRSFEWNGFENLVSFVVSVDANAPRISTQLSFEAFIEGMPIAFIPITIAIKARHETHLPGAATAVAQPLSSAFASYSSKDSDLVSLQVSALKRWDPNADVFVDCLDLQPNEDWKRELERIIPTKEAFLLFWSVNAKSSEWVAWELEHARASKGIGWIRPMPIDDPEIAPPPEFLRHLQFRDKYLVMRQAFLRYREQR
jgi:serine/threonine protein kinase